METPVAFPALPASARTTYVVNDALGTLTEQQQPPQQQGDSTAADHAPLWSDWSNGGNGGNGGSSVSELDNGDHWLVTSPVRDGVLAVTLLSTSGGGAAAAGEDHEPVATIHLDFRAECSVFATANAGGEPSSSSCAAAIVAAQAFSVAENLLQLVLVDAAAVILTVRFNLSLTPVAVVRGHKGGGALAELRCFAVPAAVDGGDAAAGGGGGAGIVQRPRLRSTMVAFLNCHTVLLALNPFLVAADVMSDGEETTTTSRCWSETKCLEDMRNRVSGVRRLLRRGADLLAGPMGDLVVVDMSPIAALCCCTASADDSSSSRGASSSSVFTLHSDGVVRHWIYQQPESNSSSSSSGGGSNGNLLPFAVRQLPVRLPDPTTWMDGWNTTFLTAAAWRAPNKDGGGGGDDVEQQRRETATARFVLAIHIHTSEDSDALEALTDDTSSRPTAASKRHALLVLEGPVQITEGGDATTMASHVHVNTVPLKVPRAVTGLVGMQLEHVAAGYCQLRAMFRTNVASSSSLVVYPLDPSSSSSSIVISNDPIPTPAPETTLDGVALQERERLARLSFLSSCGRLEDDAASSSSSVPDILHAMDARFLQYLFRPAFPRGNGTVLPPAAAHIGAAMRKLGRQGTHHSNDNNSSSSIELQVVRFVQEWRRRDQHQNMLTSLRTPVRSTRRHQHPPHSRPTPLTTPPDTAMAYAHTPGADSQRTMYDTLDDDDDYGEDQVAEEEEEEEEVDVVQVEMDLVRDEREIKEHERRWRALLLEIWKEEASDRAPLCLAIPANSADAAIIVRPACISVAVRSNGGAEEGKQQHVPGSRRALDEHALDTLAGAAADAASRRILEQAEMFALESLARGEMALVPRHVQELKQSLNSIDVEALSRSNGAESWQAEIGTMTRDELDQFQRGNIFGSSLPGLCLLSSAAAANSPPLEAPRRPVLASQSRLAAASVLVRAADSARRLYLGRFLALCEIDSRASETALLLYLHVLNVLLVSARTVPFPPVPLGNSDLQPLQLDRSGRPTSPPMKRTKVSSILEAPPNKTVVLDSLLIQLSQRVGPETGSRSLTAHFSALCGVAAKLSLQVGGAWSSPQLPPEVGLLCLPAAGIDPQAAPLVVRLVAPSVALPLPNEHESDLKKRKVLFARCLLLACHSESPERAKAMVSRAFALLPYDATKTDESMEHLGVLEARTGGNAAAGKRLLTYINDAIVQVQNVQPENWEQTLDSLHSRRFNTALTIRDWGAAHTACLQHPNLKRKAENFKRFVRGLVDAGALSVLVEKCISVENDAENFQQVNSLYSIAVETLAEIGSHDIYTFGETASDYQAALYNLHVCHGNWRSAAQALDARYLQARQALESPVHSEEETNREDLAVNDMVLGAVGTYNAMTLLSDGNSSYLISGVKSLYPSIPASALSDNGGTKHSREGTPRAGALDANVRDRGQYMNMDDIELRAVRCNVLKTLYVDGMSDSSSFAKSAYVDDDISNVDVVERLFLQGYYQEGLQLAKAMDKVERCKPGGYGFFHDSLSRLIANILLPLAMDKECVPARPSLRQLQAGMEGLGNPADPPVLVAGPRHKKAKSLARSEIRTAAMNLIRLLVTRYSSAEQPFAVELATEMLSGDRPLTVLPSWLEHLLLFGTNDADLPGLFARCRAPQAQGYLGHPAHLLSLYTSRGLYKDACRVVTTVLEGPNTDFRERAAPSRTPETGEVDFVPYDKIDLLWNLIELAVKKGRVDKGEMLHARSKMEESLEKYFSLLKISEMGTQSTRALSSS